MKTTFRLIWFNAKDSLIIAVAVTQSLLAGGRAFALPSDGQVAAGKATINTPSPTTMQIGQESNHAVINWNSFGIGKEEAVNISQPASQSTLLNRVLGNDPSSIFGTLTANGRVFLVNPNGMLFAPGASVDVGGLVASTLAINDSDFLAGKYAFFQDGRTASVINQGYLRGGFIALLGNNTTNTGTIITTKGSTGLGAGSGITLGLDSCGLVTIKVDQSAYNAQITNNGVIEADGGTVIVNASAANELLGSVVNNSGKIRASSITERDGKIVIEGGAIINTGTLTSSVINASAKNLVDSGIWNADGIDRGGTISINATGSIEQTATSSITADGGSGGSIRIQAGENLYLSGIISTSGSTLQGGQISITAPQTLLAGTSIAADGPSGGGSIRIGGGWQGKDALLANATTTVITKSSKLNANALDNGNGGTVVVWSEQSTDFAGAIEAKGGTNSGNGGNVEVSGHENLAMSGQITMASPYGENGQLLIDPRNITIDNNTTSALFSLISLPDANPAEGDQHGSGNIVELLNGNIIVASPLDDFVAIDAGAVRLYKPDGTLLSMLSGSSANDLVGEKVTALNGNNNAVTITQKWSNTGVAGVGAITWIDGTTGVSGSVSETNSLIGSTLNDGTLATLTTLTNGNYVVGSPSWNNGAVVDAGAVTWGNGATGTVGVISAANSLVGSKASDGVSSKVTALTNGNYVVSSLSWDNGSTTNVGAVTWGNGAGGTVGAISAANSLIGSKSGDNVGTVTALTNGNYVVSSPLWNGSTTDAGAVTWGNGQGGLVGTISASNSLVGSKSSDKVGASVTALANGNYVVNSPTWDNGTTIDAGAVTWGDGATGSVGLVSTSNSLIGSAASDGLSSTVVALTNGNYVVGSPNWDNGAMVNAGAITWGDGTTGTVGTISTTNSLVGSSANDGISYTIAALTNGNYVVGSPHWDNGIIIDVGAVTLGSGVGGTVGSISETNSLIGSTTNDGSIYNIVALSNGNYLVGSPNWDNGAATEAGAVTWGNGDEGTVGTISIANSLVGSTKNDFAGSDNSGSNRITALKNGNYVVSSSGWDKGSAVNAGAVTWGDGLNGTVGVISATNSLVGSKTGDQVGTITAALPNGNYVTGSSTLDNGSLSNVGAVTLGNGHGGLVGAVSTANSLMGSSKDDQLSSGGITPLTVSGMNGSFVVSSISWSNNTGKVEILTPQVVEESLQQEGYSSSPDTDNTFTPNQITTLLNAGDNVILKANNNITVNSAIITDNPLGNGGNLDLYAGQSILINASITTDSGNMTLVSNDTQANGVVDAWRSAGNAVITMAAGTSINAGTGNVTIELRDGAGRTNSESGDITLRTISAGSISAVNNGTTAGSGVTLASGTLAASATSGKSIVLAGKDFNNSAGVILSTAGTARWLVYSANPGSTLKGMLTSDFRHYDATYTSYAPLNVSESGNGFIYTSVPGQLSVNTTLASGKASSYYGDQPDATYSYTLTGFSDNEDNAGNIGLTGTMMVSGTPTATSNTGNYTVNYDSGLSSSSGFTFAAGNGLAYTVEPQPIDISADDQDKTYDENDPPLTWDPETQSNGHGLIAGDIFTGELAREPGEDVGSYAITLNTLNNSNYAINYTGANLTINQRPITLSARNASTIYGEVDPALEVTITDGSLGNLTVSDALNDVTGILNRQTGSNVGSYDINLGSGSKAGNYNITFVADNNAFSVTQRPITISASALNKTYGDSDPTLTWSAEAQSSGRGLLPGDSFSGELSRADGENVSNYAIAQNTLNNSNYAINYTGANLTINQRPMTLSATAAFTTYGEADPALGVTITSGSLGSETVSDALSDITGLLSRQTGFNVGSYDINLGSGSKAGNYNITFVADNNAFSITKRPINISANALSKIYGDVDPMLNWQADAQSSGQQQTLRLNQTFNAASEIYVNPDYTPGMISQTSELEKTTTDLLAINDWNNGEQSTTGYELTQPDNASSGGFIAGSTIEVPEPAEKYFVFSMPESMFSHSNPDAVISLEVASVNGSSIPSWMSFDPERKIISGTPPKEAAGEYRVELIARDQFGGELITVVLIKIG
ncbi:MAG: MBG domain-containing protein [Chlorobium sp.]